MNLTAEFNLISAALDAYRQQLDIIPDEQFDQTPPNGGWSCAEVYSHIMQASLGATIAAEKCCRKTGINTTRGLNWEGKITFLLNRFLVKRKAPEALDSHTRKISKEEARNLLIKLRKRVDVIWPLSHDATAQNKISHPKLGMLNAAHWIKFLRLHLQHHLKQLNRLIKSFQHR